MQIRTVVAGVLLLAGGITATSIIQPHVSGSPAWAVSMFLAVVANFLGLILLTVSLRAYVRGKDGNTTATR